MYFRDLLSFQPRYFTVGKSIDVTLIMNVRNQEQGHPLCIPCFQACPQNSLTKSHRKLVRHAEIVTLFVDHDIEAESSRKILKVILKNLKCSQPKERNGYNLTIQTDFITRQRARVMRQGW